ncbi:hypothetical protein ON010_g5070 [Phytophthora cinnamomi]|nr:hypothetical protein ON010_g5070 [Phytophthora cinnamomi]
MTVPVVTFSAWFVYCSIVASVSTSSCSDTVSDAVGGAQARRASRRGRQPLLLVAAHQAVGAFPCEYGLVPMDIRWPVYMMNMRDNLEFALERMRLTEGPVALQLLNRNARRPRKVRSGVESDTADLEADTVKASWSQVAVHGLVS